RAVHFFSRNSPYPFLTGRGGPSAPCHLFTNAASIEQRCADQRVLPVGTDGYDVDGCAAQLADALDVRAARVGEVLIPAAFTRRSHPPRPLLVNGVDVLQMRDVGH